MHMYMCVMNKY